MWDPFWQSARSDTFCYIFSYSLDSFLIVHITLYSNYLFYWLSYQLDYKLNESWNCDKLWFSCFFFFFVSMPSTGQSILSKCLINIWRSETKMVLTSEYNPRISDSCLYSLGVRESLRHSLISATSCLAVSQSQWFLHPLFLIPWFIPAEKTCCPLLFDLTPASIFSCSSSCSWFI